MIDTSPTSMMEASWAEKLREEFSKSYMKQLAGFLADERKKGPVYPPFSQVFSAFCYTPFEKVRVVIMGQDPYHGEGQAHGLSFSVCKGVTPPPSLKNIFKELKSDLGVEPPLHGFLDSWSRQGVLMLNATLTVRAKEPKSHYGQGWERFTDRVIQLLCERVEPLVFLLWGKSAIEKFQHIQPDGKTSPHLVLSSAHPSPFAAHAGFFGSRPFSKTNEFLKKQGKASINWGLEP